MKQAITWIITNSAFTGALFYGFYADIEGLQNIIFSFAWIFIVLSFFMPSIIKPLGKKHTIPTWIRYTQDLICVGIFAYYGAIVTAVFWFIHMLFVEVALDKMAKPVEEDKEQGRNDHT